MTTKKSFTSKKATLKTNGPTPIKTDSSTKTKSGRLPIDETLYVMSTGATIEPTANTPREQKGY